MRRELLGLWDGPSAGPAYPIPMDQGVRKNPSQTHSVVTMILAMQKNDKEKVNRVIFYGSLPRPVTGMAVVNKYIIDKLSQKCSVYTINTSNSHPRGSSLYIFKRIYTAINACYKILLNSLFGAKTLYMSVDDGLGILGNIAVVFISRVARIKVYMHHHSYKYIISYSRLTALLVWMAGRNATHIFLCECMASDFISRYPRTVSFLIAPNSVEEPNFFQKLTSSDSSKKLLTIGLLSNLSFEKGVSEFIEIIDTCISQNINVRGILAGPAVSEEVKDIIENALHLSNGRLEWRGPIYGEEKDLFFSEIDLFVFPTKYATESFGLVILESLVRGVPVIAWERGCINLFTQIESAVILKPDQPIATISSNFIRLFLDDPKLLDDWKIKSRDQGQALNDSFRSSQNFLINTIASS